MLAGRSAHSPGPRAPERGSQNVSATYRTQCVYLDVGLCSSQRGLAHAASQPSRMFGAPQPTPLILQSGPNPSKRKLGQMP